MASTEAGSGERMSLRPVLQRLGVVLVALPAMVLVYMTKERALVTASAEAAVAALVLLGLLVGSGVARQRQALYAGGLALVTFELTWALGYWEAPPIIVGAALWLALYVAAGLSEHHLRGTLDKGIAREFGVVALIAMAIVVALQPWRA